MEFWIGVLCSTVACVLYRLIANRLFPNGVLRIDHSNPNKDTYRFEIPNLDILAKKKYIVLKIDNHADLSQE